MTTKWSHLPNAIHIDRVMASLKANPKAWIAHMPILVSSGQVKLSVELASRQAAWDTAWDTIWHTAKLTINDNPKYLASNAIMALIAWDDCAHLLYSDPDHVKLLVALGVPAAILLYPACIVFSKERELT